MGFRIRRASDHTIVPGIPTPRLIEAHRADAFEKDGIWYLREDGTMHVSPDGQYTRVIVEHTEDYRVDLQVTLIPDRDGDGERFPDYFIVEAASGTEASHLAMAKATAQYGDDETAVDVSVIRTRQGVSI